MSISTYGSATFWYVILFMRPLSFAGVLGNVRKKRISKKGED